MPGTLIAHHRTENLLISYSQNKRFQLFDYGRSENLRRYGTEAPLNIGAHYNLIDIPVDLVVGTKDGLIPAEMIAKHYNNMRHNGVEVGVLMCTTLVCRDVSWCCDLW